MKNNSENYLERIPVQNSLLYWNADSDKMVTLEIENTGVFNRIAQKLFKKPRTSYIHLDKMGSFIWQLADGKKSIIDMGPIVKEHFGDDAEPLYERLAEFFRRLESYNFITWK